MKHLKRRQTALEWRPAPDGNYETGLKKKYRAFQVGRPFIPDGSLNMPHESSLTAEFAIGKIIGNLFLI